MTLTLLTSNATHALLEALCAAFESASGCSVTIRADSAKIMLGRIRDGEAADVAVLNAPDVDELVAAASIDGRTRRLFARSYIGVAVRKGAAHPDISTVDLLKRALLAADGIAHTVHGASGMYVPTLLQRLGIADRVRTVTRPGGLIAKVVGAGEAEIAIQQMSELLAVPDVEIVGALPSEVQKTFESAAGIFATSQNRAASETLLRFFAQESNGALFTRHGLEQARADTP